MWGKAIKPQGRVIHRQEAQGSKIKDPHWLWVLNKQEAVQRFRLSKAFLLLPETGDFLQQLLAGCALFFDLQLPIGAQPFFLLLNLDALGEQTLDVTHADEQQHRSDRVHWIE